MFAITAIKGIGRRLANVACKKAEVDLAKRAGELSGSHQFPKFSRQIRMGAAHFRPIHGPPLLDLLQQGLQYFRQSFLVIRLSHDESVAVA